MTKDINTREFYFSALLITNGFKLIESEKRENGVYFRFINHDDDLYNKLKEDFATYNAYVNMSKFVKATAKLRKELDKHR